MFRANTVSSVSVNILASLVAVSFIHWPKSTCVWVFCDQLSHRSQAPFYFLLSRLDAKILRHCYKVMNDILMGEHNVAMGAIRTAGLFRSAGNF